jgi:ribose 5-phosphate isomerase B
LKIAIGSDHGGYELKEQLIDYLKGKGFDVTDCGTHSKESCDYPLIGFEVAKAVSEGQSRRGILICKTGVGMAIIANKVNGIRAAACYDKDMAKSSREHNDCNVVVLAASYTDFKRSKEILDVWLNTSHIGDRHARRVCQIKEIESKLKRNAKK